MSKTVKKLFISKKNLEILIKNLKTACDEFIAPEKSHLDDIIFGDIKGADGGLLDYEGNSVISPRAFLLPQTEPILEIKSVKDNRFAAVHDAKKRIFYGVRPCDIKAVTLMRAFFLSEPADAAYKEKLENSTFITVACAKKCASESFCYEMGSGPFAESGFDLQLTPVNRGYMVEAGSKKGSRIVKENKGLFTKATAADEKEAKEAFKKFTKGAKRVGYKKLAGIIKGDKIKESVWDDIGLRCVVCSGCVTLCPTCSCFGVADRLNGDTGIRMRYCDGCPYAGFTRMAGGNTPFALHKDHIRRFFEHKLSVDVERYGTPSCVGCARCIRTCPGNISIKRFIDETV